MVNINNAADILNHILKITLRETPCESTTSADSLTCSEEPLPTDYARDNFHIGRTLYRYSVISVLFLKIPHPASPLPLQPQTREIGSLQASLVNAICNFGFFV